MMLSHVSQTHTIWQILLHEVACRLREEHLTAMSGTHYSRCEVYVQPNIAFRRRLRFTRVQSHADTYPHTFRPGSAGKYTLRSHSCRNSINSTRKSNKECIPLSVDLVTVVLSECCTQQASALSQYTAVALP